MKPTKKGNVAFASGYNRIKQTRYGWMIYNPNDEYVGRSFDAYGECIEAEVQFLLGLVGPEAVVMDVGANYGAVTVPLARKVSHVHAFEPQREAFCALAGSLALNCLANVSCWNIALGATPGSIRVPALDYAAGNNIGGLSLDPGRTAPGYDVAVGTLDGYVERHGIMRLDLVKVDVEGMEEQVLRGGENALRRFRPLLYVEADRPDKVESLKACLRSLGYTLEPHEPPLFNPRNFFGNPVNVWGRSFVSINLLCRPGTP